MNVPNLVTIAAATATAFGMMLLASPDAEASVSPECWLHLAGVKKSNTPASDRRYHLERGEYSPCTEQDAADSGSSTKRNDDPPSNGNRRDSSSDSGDSGSDESSRYCRKHWYC